MSSNFSESWLEWAIQIEDEAACDVEAGLDLGQYLGQYLAKSQGYISHEKLISMLQEELGAILSQEDLEVIARETENQVRNYIQKKFHNCDVA